MAPVKSSGSRQQRFHLQVPPEFVRFCRGCQEDDMADILVFNRRDTGTGRGRRKACTAEVIIFPGVTIQRDDFSLADRVDRRPVRRAKTATVALEE